MRKGWTLLSRSERRTARLVLVVILLAALSSAAMIGSIMPFLSVLSKPKRIHEVGSLSQLYVAGGFTSDYQFLVALGLGSLLVILLSSLLQVLRIWATARFTTRRSHTLSYRLLSAYLRQPYEYFLDHHSGTLSSHILGEVQVFVGQFLMPAATAVTSFLTSVVIITFVLWVNALVGLIAFVLIGGLYGATLFLSRRVIAKAGRVRAETNAERFRIANEALGGVKDIKLLGRERNYIDRFVVPSSAMSGTQFVVSFFGELPQYVMQAIIFGGMILLCLFLVQPDAFSSDESLGELVPLLGVFAFAGQRLMPELQKLYFSLTQLTYSRQAVENLHSDLVGKDDEGEVPEASSTSLRFQDELNLERVSYRYPTANRDGLQELSLTIRAGEKIGVVGTSGAGKTTFADLVLGLLIPKAGRMIVDGTVLTKDNLRFWQNSVGYVPQNIFLTDSTIAENIALGSPPEQIDWQRIETAARLAQLDNFIRDELPHGYQTLVGERGVRLSGGQRQRIGIARAIYHDASLIIFDEATSALDNITEREVMEAVDSLPGDKTVLVIAHRLSTVRRCDRILILDQGRVSGFDCWDKLLKTNEGFRKMTLASTDADMFSYPPPET